MSSKFILILFVIVAIGSVVEFNRHYLSRITVAQQRFDSAVREVGEVLQQEDRRGEALPDIYFGIKSSLPTMNGHWELQSSYDEENMEQYQQSLRLLELANTAKIFNQSNSDNSRKPPFVVVARIDDRSFKANLSAQVVSQSLAIQKLIILLQQYSISDEQF